MESEPHGRWFLSIYEIRTLLGEKQVLKTTLYHEVPGTNYVSTRVISWKNETGASGTRQFDYAYDSSGNITMMRIGGKSTMYQYNGLQQLTREDNQAAGKTWVYTYDAGGNILTKTEYAYTTGTPGTAQKTITYKYGDSQWRDLLTEYNGKTVTSDAIGNIKNDGTWDYSWEHGRQLASQTKSGTRIAYSYDANGMRLKKIVNGTAYDYCYNGNLLTHMSTSGWYAHIRYSAEGMPVHIQYKNGSNKADEYYYMFNAQGDVVGLLDGTGKLVVEYTYDAWGQPLTITGSMKDTLGKANPLRYRCYVYDEETGMYYLGSRYYNPVMGRFISTDSTSTLTASKALTDKNLYAYCDSNPTSRVDDEGDFWNPISTAIGAAVGAIAGVAGQVLSDAVTSFCSSKIVVSSWQSYVGAAIGGAVGGAVFGGTGNVDAANAASGFATTASSMALEKCFGNSNASWLDIGKEAAKDGVASFALAQIGSFPKVSRGRGSMTAVYSRGLSRIRNNNASRMSLKVVGKGIISNFAGGGFASVRIGVKQAAANRRKR